MDSGDCIPDHVGCMVPSSLNYDSLATRQASCTYAYHGCTDSTAGNFMPWANTDDSTCVHAVAGCADVCALNFDSLATISEECVYEVIGCADSTALNYASDVNTPWQAVHATLLRYLEKMQDEADRGVVVGLERDLQLAECQHIRFGCVLHTAFNYNSLATRDDGSCVVLSPPPSPPP
eukprot:2646887-Prymnesium_polylepis.1